MTKKKSKAKSLAIDRMANVIQQATDVQSFLLYDILMLQDVQVKTIDDVDNIILTSARYNYYERLMLHHILRSSQQLRASTTSTLWAEQHESKGYVNLNYSMTWMLNLLDSQSFEDFTWSDNTNKLLRTLHKATIMAGSYGPVWLSSQNSVVENDDEFEVGLIKELVEQLTKDGIVSRGKNSLFKCMEKARWPALEEEMLEVEDGSVDESKDEDAEEVMGFEEREEEAAKAVDHARDTLRAHRDAARLREGIVNANRPLHFLEIDDDEDLDEEDYVCSFPSF